MAQRNTDQAGARRADINDRLRAAGRLVQAGWDTEAARLISVATLRLDRLRHDDLDNEFYNIVREGHRV